MDQCDFITTDSDKVCDNVLAPSDLCNVVVENIDASENYLKAMVETQGQDRALEYLRTKREFSQGELDSALISACQHGFYFLTQSLLHQGANIDCRDEGGNTPLMISISQGYVDIATFLMRKNADVNVENSSGDTALMLCIRTSGSVELVNMFMEKRDVNFDHQNNEGYTILMKAVEALDINVVYLILQKRKTDFTQKRNCKNETAQQIADNNGIGNVFRLLSDSSGDPIETAIESRDIENLFILTDCHFRKHESVFEAIFQFHDKNMVPFDKNSEKLVKRLLTWPVKVHNDLDPEYIALKLGSYTILELLLQFRYKFRSYINRPLNLFLVYSAVANRRIDLLELLIRYKAVFDETILLNCFNKALKNGNLECAKLLLALVALGNIKSAFVSAIQSNNPEIVTFLFVKYGYKIKKWKNKEEELTRLLILASRVGNVEALGLLLDDEANINGELSNTTTAATALTEAKNGEVINYLVQRGAEISINKKPPPRYNFIPHLSSFHIYHFMDGDFCDIHSSLIYYLSREDRVDDLKTKEGIVQALLKNGAVVNDATSRGRTPLMIAASQSNSRNILQMLVEHGAGVYQRDQDGNSVLLYAVEKNVSENVTFILQNAKGGKELINLNNNKGLTPLMAAVKLCNNPIVVELIDAGANVNDADLNGVTVLCHAMFNIDFSRQIIPILIRAGCLINAQNQLGLTSFMRAVLRGADRSILEMLIDNGADINVVIKRNREITALTLLFGTSDERINLQRAEVLLDLGAHASYAGTYLIHKLILRREIKLIPKLIASGMGPAELSFQTQNSTVVDSRSPLFLSLMVGKVGLARYFVENWFLTNSDVYNLGLTDQLRRYLENKNARRSLQLLDQLSRRTTSLEMLSFLAVQGAVGPSPGREDRIKKLQLPNIIKNKLLFTSCGDHSEITNDTETAVF